MKKLRATDSMLIPYHRPQVFPVPRPCFGGQRGWTLERDALGGHWRSGGGGCVEGMASGRGGETHMGGASAWVGFLMIFNGL